MKVVSKVTALEAVQFRGVKGFEELGQFFKKRGYKVTYNIVPKVDGPNEFVHVYRTDDYFLTYGLSTWFVGLTNSSKTYFDLSDEEMKDRFYRAEGL